MHVSSKLVLLGSLAGLAFAEDHPQDDCAKACSNDLFACKSQPNANQAYCVSTFNSCVGYEAIGDGQADYYPTSCKKDAREEHQQDDCAKACSNELFACKSKPDANQSFCVSTFNTCVGYMAIGNGKADYYPATCHKGSSTTAQSSATPTAHPQDDCAKACSNALFECKSKPDANQAYCVSTFNTCVGYMAIGNGQADYYPEHCSKGSSSSAASSAATATATAHPQDDCAKACSNALFECKSKPDANQAYCVATFNSCVGYMAIGNGKADYYPEHCSKEAPSTTMTSAVASSTSSVHQQDACAKACSDQLFQCKSKPSANQAYCVSTFNSCVGYEAIGDGKADYYPSQCKKATAQPSASMTVSSSVPGSSTPVTAGVDTMKPALALAVLGLAAAF